ncbi:MAG: hypothetical protein KAX45_02800 [Chitinophagaceae bacterium]|nr:hypothetical protein [Chitinophagaceae bacterium]MBP6590038.1 hypothetical protein [Chitinophagaceae bacterium]MBP8243446.1 hypothetical protein [Chitinophagaceae bacterium]
MKKNIYMLAGLISILALSSCIKQIDKTFQGQTVVEIDPTVLNSANATAGYPVLTRIPAEGIPLRTADSTLRRLNGIIRVRLNLVGPQLDQAQTIGYKILTASPITSVSFPATATGQSPSAAAATLTVTNAVAGTHYTALSGSCTIAPKSSYGYIEIPIINGGATAGQARFLGIQLDSSGTLKPNPNYNKIGLAIDQR